MESGGLTVHANRNYSGGVFAFVSRCLDQKEIVPQEVEFEVGPARLLKLMEIVKEEVNGNPSDALVLCANRLSNEAIQSIEGSRIWRLYLDFSKGHVKGQCYY